VRALTSCLRDATFLSSLLLAVGGGFELDCCEWGCIEAVAPLSGFAAALRATGAGAVQWEGG
jgi:hypothetical protein